MITKKSAWIRMILAMVIFGTIGLFVRGIALPSSVVALDRAVVGVLFLLIVLLLRRERISFTAIRANALWLLLSGSALGFNWILLFESYRYTSVAMATLCYYMAPILVILVSPLVLREKLTPVKIACVAAALAGMFLLSGVPQSGIPAAGELRGILLGLAAAVLYASIMLLNKKLRDISAYDRTVVQLGISAVLLLVYCLFTAEVDTTALTLSTIGMLIFVGIVHTGAAYLLYFGSMGELPGQTAAILSYIDPVVAVLVSVVLLHENMTAAEGVGAVLILGAAVLSELPLTAFKKRRQEK